LVTLSSEIGVMLDLRSVRQEIQTVRFSLIQCDGPARVPGAFVPDRFCNHN
jgi:hypothetical protein